MSNPVTVGELRRVLADIPADVAITIYKFTGPNMTNEKFYLSHTAFCIGNRCIISFDDRNGASDPFESDTGRRP
jgi:hypothetical protein